MAFAQVPSHSSEPLLILCAYSDSLYLDPAIRDWVLFPITLVMILIGLLRHYVTLLLNTPPKKQPAGVVREQRALLRSQLLRQSATLSPLPPTLYKSLSATLHTALQTGTLISAPSASTKPDAGPANPLADPAQMEGMMDGMKKQAVMMVPNMVVMQWINVFFSGFVLRMSPLLLLSSFLASSHLVLIPPIVSPASFFRFLRFLHSPASLRSRAVKLPFPLTYGFKPMLQRDIATPDMPVPYVSALSWYFLTLFGLSGILKLLLPAPEEMQPDSGRDMTVVRALGGAQGGPVGMGAGPDMGKVHRAEAENLALAEGMYRWAGEGVEERVLALWGMAGSEAAK